MALTARAAFTQAPPMTTTSVRLVTAIAAALIACDNESPPVDDRLDGGTMTVAPLEDIVEPIRTAHALPSLGVAVVRSAGLVDQAVVGVRKLGDPTAATPSDPYHLGSNTKAMTASLVATLVDDGVWTWTTSVAGTLEAVVPNMHSSWRDVTVEELLSHQAGIDDEAAYALMPEPSPARAVSDNRLAAVRAVMAEPAVGRRGRYAYSNVGYVMAGVMAEIAMNQTWETLVATRVFAPLGMHSCGFGAPGTAGAVDAPWGHAIDGGALQAIDPGSLLADNPAELGPAGTVHCSLADWGRFVAMHLRGARGSNAELLAPESFDRAFTPLAGDYGLGWVIGDSPSGRTIAHDGSNLRFHSYAVIVPQHDIAILVVKNASAGWADEAISDVLRALSDRFNLSP